MDEVVSHKSAKTQRNKKIRRSRSAVFPHYFLAFAFETSLCKCIIRQHPFTGLDIDRWPDRFFHLLWPVGPVALAVHWPERASDRQFGPQGVCSALARNVNQI